MTDVFNELELDAEQQRQVAKLALNLPALIDTALAAVMEAADSVTVLQRLRDPELSGPGFAGPDLVAELAGAGRCLRNAARVAEHRAQLLDEAVSDRG